MLQIPSMNKMNKVLQNASETHDVKELFSRVYNLSDTFDF